MTKSQRQPNRPEALQIEGGKYQRGKLLFYIFCANFQRRENGRRQFRVQ